VGTVIFDLQLNPGVAPWPVVRDAAIAAEEAGYHTLWTVDHLAGDVMQAPDMPECFTLLGALAGVTSRIGLGPLVVNAHNRHPALLANSVATMQNITAGRFVLGLGAGSAPGSPFASERHAVRWPPPATMRERHEVVERVFEAMDEIWAADRGSHLARFPRPVTRPRVILGVNSTGLSRLAGARADGINVRASNERVGEYVAAARAARADAGRDGDFDVTVWEHFDERLLDGSDPRLARWRELGVTRVILLVFREIDPARIARSGALVRRPS
jgi:alkanesulfonate monooxygenase SsuD/methylene tetrahydromethanopterin reductase-like flavin-dependent oxidoreductase (luciferase family)